MDWLSAFGDVISEVTEELFEEKVEKSSAIAAKLPPVGNGIYIVTMRLKKDLPNWVLMYGGKICLDYKARASKGNVTLALGRI